jgi:hypothetical protein
MTNPYPIIKILWQDAVTSSEPGWTTKEEALHTASIPPPTMETVGYVIHNCENWIAVTDSVGEDEFSQVTKIPKSLIKEIIYLNDRRKDEENINSFVT